jgi:hypothetical protein
MKSLRARRSWPRDLDIANRLLSGQTLGQIGLEYGVTRERVRQILKRCIVSARAESPMPNDPRFDDIRPRIMREDRLWWRAQFRRLATVYGVEEKAA